MWTALVGKDARPDHGGGPGVAHVNVQCWRVRNNHGLHPHMPSRCPHGATLLPCATVRCYCSAVMPNDVSTVPKVASAVSVPPHARSSHSREGTALALLNQDKALKDDFQTQHTLVHRMKQ